MPLRKGMRQREGWTTLLWTRREAVGARARVSRCQSEMEAEVVGEVREVM